MEGTPVINKRVTTNPLTVLLANGRQVSLTHICNIHIEGLPFPLTGHIIPGLSIASLSGIHVLTEVGCEVTFTKTTCVVEYNGNIILTGNINQTMDLWSLPLGTPCMTSHHSHMAMTLLAAPDCANTHAQSPQNSALFTHTVRNKANSIGFAHQSLCSPMISTLLKAICHGYLKGCPNLTAIGIAKYLNPSPATAKGHMKRPRMRIRSNQCKNAIETVTAPTLTYPPLCDNHSTDGEIEDVRPFPPTNANIIEDNNRLSDANIFCFAAFADKKTGILYNDLTGTFPFMSLEGIMCFLIVYHYKTNAILALPIAGFSDNIIFAACQQQYNLLKSKGYKIRLNAIDNQATKVIKKFLDEQQCNLLLVEPHNHCVNAAERAIQTFKVHFISALATTDSKFSLQLWDQLTPQVESTLNVLRPSHINPNVSAYKAVHSPFNWNHFPRAPPGCKAVVYKSSKTRGSWGSRGKDACCVSQSLDHYQCNHFFIPEMQAYKISGSAKLLPQHCQVLFLLWNKQLQEVTDKLVTTLKELPGPKQSGVLENIKSRLEINDAQQPKERSQATPMNGSYLRATYKV
jgi:hypothetical protein